MIWSGFAATSVGPTEVLAFLFWAYKVLGIMVVLRGICDPGLALSVEVDIWLLGVVVVEAMIGSGLADVGEDVWLIHLGVRVAFFLGFCFFPVDEDDILSKLFLFHNGVHTTLLASGVFLELGGVLLELVLGGVLCSGVGLPCTSSCTSFR